MPKTRSLYRILFYSHFTLAALLLLGVGALVYRQLVNLNHGSLQQRLTSESAFIADLVATRDSSVWRSICRQFHDRADIRVTIADTTGKVLYETDAYAQSMENHRDRPEIQAALAMGEGTAVRYSPTLRLDHMYYARLGKLSDGMPVVVRLSKPMRLITYALNESLQHLAWIVAVALLLCMVTALVVTRWVVRPIEVLREGAERFAQGRLERRLPLFPWSEVHSLADSMNRMAHQLNERIKSAILQRNETEAILSSMTEGVVAIDHQGGILRCNRAFEDLLGIRGQSVVGRKLLGLVRNTALETLLQDFGGQGNAVTRDIVVLQEGEPKVLQVRGSVLYDLEQKEIGALVVFNDVTRLRKLEEMRRDFVANVSHELKTPITSIKGFVETLQASDLSTDADSRRFLDIILKQSDRLNAIIDDLLMLSRIEQGGEGSELEFESVLVGDLFESVIQQAHAIAEKKQIAFRMDVESGLDVFGNPSLLEQALLNLATNACRYSDEHKTVVLHGLRRGNEVRLVVQDQGWGIEKRHLPRIFERFYRVDKARSRSLGGTGLGLAITKHITLLHHGRIEVESEVGVGSVFTLVFPALTES